MNQKEGRDEESGNGRIGGRMRLIDNRYSEINI
jgi:hypothetical protein